MPPGDRDVLPIPRDREFIEPVIRCIHGRWGAWALVRARNLPALAGGPVIPTGFPDLDSALGIGGIPGGRITEIYGEASTGKTGLALRLAAQVQQRGGVASYLDLSAGFDAESALAAGVDLDALLLVQPRNGGEAFEIAALLVQEAGVDLIVFDAVDAVGTARGGERARLLSVALRRLTGAIDGSHSAFVFLRHLERKGDAAAGKLPGMALRYYASLRLGVEWQGWVHRGFDIVGCRGQVTVIKNKLARPGRTAAIEVRWCE